METMSDKESGSKSYSSTDSYYHCKDVRYPVCNLTLPELYERYKTLGTDTGVTWHLPPRRLTYNQIYQQAQEIARGLLSLGLKEGDVVFSLGSQCPDSLLMFVAGTLIGLVFFATYLSDPFEKNIKYRLKTVSPKAILIGGSFSGSDLQDVGPSLFKVLAELGVEQEYINIFSDREYFDWREHVNTYPSKSADGCMSLKELAELSSKVSQQRLKDCMASISPTQPCFIVTSSGSTGEPKLILHSAISLTNMGVMHSERGDRTKSMTIGTLDMGRDEMYLFDDVMTGFHVGCEVVVLPRLRTWDFEELAVSYLEAFQQHGITNSYGDQSVISHIVNNTEMMKDYDVTTLKALVISNTGSSPAFKAKLLQNFPDSVDIYGMSECFYISSPRLGELNSSNKLKTVGRPMINSEVKIVDENGNCVPHNVKGELWVRSCYSMLQYVGNPELTQKMYTHDGWLKTGDCAIMDDDNDLQIVGRMTHSERLKVYGNAVYAQAVEFEMKKISQVETIIVVGRDRGNADGCELIYCVKLKEGESLSGEQIFEYAKENLFAHISRPVRVFFFEDFPRTGGRNKISRKDLLCQVEKMVDQNVNEGIVDPDYLT